MQTPQTGSQEWIWQQSDWSHFRWDQGALASVLARARLAQGKVLGATQLLDADLTLEAVAAILVENGVTTSAIGGEHLDVDAVRSSVARHLGLPTAGGLLSCENRLQPEQTGQSWRRILGLVVKLFINTSDRKKDPASCGKFQNQNKNQRSRETPLTA